MVKDKINKGIEIRDKVFAGNPYAQLAALREVVELLLTKLELMDDEDFAEYVALNEQIKSHLPQSL